MNAPLWAARPRPTAARSARPVGRWEPASLLEVSAGRRQLATALHDGARPAGAEESGVELLLLAYEELASNALRHGGGPVTVTVTGTGTRWLLEVSDASSDRPPTPAVGRDPAHGGLGLHLVARLAHAHGWTIDGDRKIVWASIDHRDTDDRDTDDRTGARQPIPPSGDRHSSR
jgi:anti-sigma regulatory factor (Ser/Thr protein kinase)